MPVSGIVPVGSVDDRIQAGAENRDAGRARALELDGDVGHPARAAAADVARLGDDERALVALRDLAQQRRQGDAARVVEAPFEPAGAHLPLAVVVVVDADEIERRAAAAELGKELAVEHVPGLPLVLGDLVGAPGELGRVARRRDVDERLDVEEAGAGVFGTDRLDAAQGRAHETPLRFPADVAPGPVVAAARVDLAAIGMNQMRL